MKNEDIIKALKWRYATKVFDPNKKVSEEDMRTILESGRLAPSSFGIEAWKFIVVKNPEMRAKLRAAAYDQGKVTDASHLIVVARRTDAEAIAPELIARTAAAQGKPETEMKMFSDMVSGAVAGKGEAAGAWFASQTYIALGMMVETAALLGIDTGPMEGFDPKQADEILGLSQKNVTAVTMLAVGYRGEDPYANLPKVRRSFEEAVEVVG